MLTPPVLSFVPSSALVIAVEISRSSWVIAAHVPGLGHVKVRRRIAARGEALLLAVEQLKRRAVPASDHVIVTYETGSWRSPTRQHG
jgi:hypothetical protein